MKQGHYDPDHIVAFDCEMVKSKETGKLLAGSVAIVNFEGNSIYEVERNNKERMLDILMELYFG